MARRDARALRDEVAAAIDKGKFKVALEAISELEQLEPRDASWPKRAAEVYRKIGRTREAVAAYERAAERYAQAGFLVQAIAVCKLILQLDPQHSATVHRLSAMTEQRSTSPVGMSSISRDAIPELMIARNTGQFTTVDPATLMAPDRPVAMLDANFDDGVRRTPRATSIPIDVGPTEVTSPSIADFQLPDDSGDFAPAAIEPSVDVPIDVGTMPPPSRRPATVTFLPETRPAPPAPPAPSPRPTGARPPPIPSAAKRRRSTTPPIAMKAGAALESVSLSEVMPGATPDRDRDGTSSGIIVIPLEDLDDVTGPIDIEALPPSAFHEDTFEVGLDAVETPDDDLDQPDELSLTALADDEEHPLGAPQMLSSAARRALQATPLLAGFDPEMLEHLVERLDLVHLEAGQVLFHEGDPGDTLFVISEGEVAVVSEGPPRTEVSRLFTGSFFGELALVTDQPRSATIQAVSRTELLAIDRDVIAALVAEHPDVLRVILRFIKNRLVDRVILTSPLFVQFPETERRGLAELFEFLEVEPGTRLVTHGKRPDGLYVLLAGRAEVLREIGDGGEATRSIGWLGTGEVFGEMALWGSELSLATVKARGKVLALRMPAATFREVIMTHPQVLAYVGDLAEERRRSLEAPPEDSEDMVDLKIDDLL